MARKFIITEEQYRMLMEAEDNSKIQIPLGGNDNTTTTQNSNNNPLDSAKKTVDALEQKGINPKDVEINTSVKNLTQQNVKEKGGDATVKIDGDEVKKSGTPTTESKIISVKDLKENRFKVLREHSECFQLNDFFKKLR